MFCRAARAGILAAAALSICFSQTSAPPKPIEPAAGDETAVRLRIDQLFDTLNTSDEKQLSEFTAGAEQVSATRALLRLTAYWNEVPEMPMSEVSSPFWLEEAIFFSAPTEATVSGRVVQVGSIFARSLKCSFRLTKSKDGWRIASATLVAPRPLLPQ